MASQYSSGLLLIIVVVILVGVEFSNAKCYQGHVNGGQRKYESEPKFVLGRKLLQGMKVKSIGIQERDESPDAERSFPIPQTESDHIPAKNEGSKAFEKAADEIANLMHKDYKGQGRPRRKPPINNHEPHN